MSRRTDPTMRRRRLGRELRRHREAAGRTHVQVAEALGCSDAKVSYIESGRYKIQWRDVRDMLDFCGVDDPDVVDPLIEMARQSAEKSWWAPFRSTVPHWFETFVGLETEAATVLHYEQMGVPGLLQTEDYAAALVRVGVRSRPEERSKVIELRVERQRRLTDDDPLELRAVIEEAALLRPVGGESVHVAQMEHLIDLGKRPNVGIQVLPTAVGAHPGLAGSFSVFVFDEDPAVAYFEGQVAGAYLEEPEDVRAYLTTFDRLRSDALSRQASAELIEGIVEG